MMDQTQDQESMIDEGPDRIVLGTAIMVVGIMLVGMIAFPLAAMWSRAGTDRHPATTRHHGSLPLVMVHR